jgi:sugar phosphate permease
MSTTKKIISNDKISLRQWIVVGCGALFYCYQFIIRASPNVMNDDLMSAFQIDATALGVIIGFYYYGYSGIQIPLGIMMDRIGPRRLLSAAGILLGASCYAFAATRNTTIAAIARLVMGVGSAFGFVGALKLGSQWFPRHKFGNAIALTMVMGTLGAILSQAPLSLLNDLIGWEASMKVLAMIGIGLAAFTVIVARDTPEGGPIDTSEDDEDSETGHVLSDFLTLIKKPQFWIISLIGFLMYVPLTIMGIAWSAPFLKSVYGVNESLASGAAMAMFLGGAIGSPFYTTLSDRLRSRKKPILMGAIIGLCIYLIILYWPATIPITVMYALFFVAGFAYAGKVVCFAAVCEIMPLSASGTAVSSTNMIVMVSGIVCHPLIGYLLDLKWGGIYEGGKILYAPSILIGGTEAPLIDPYYLVSHVGANHVYSADAFRFAFSIIPICLVLALVSLRFLRETHPAHNIYQEFNSPGYRRRRKRKTA